MRPQELCSKFVGSMLSAALGDSMGASLHVRGNRELLKYTDDTAMMIAIAEALIESDGKINPQKLAWKFIEKYDQEPWRGYGPGPPKIFKLIKKGMGPLELDRKLYPGGSYGNGAAMRIAPIGLFFHDDFQALKAAVKTSCKPTHNHPLAVEGAMLEAFSVSKAVRTAANQVIDPVEFVEQLIVISSSEIYQYKLKAVMKLVQRETSRREIVKELGNGVESFNSVPTAIYCYLRKQDPLETIRFAISLRGDVDTIACMAGAIAGAHKGWEVLPGDLLKKLENREYIENLAKKLCELKLRLRGGV